MKSFLIVFLVFAFLGGGAVGTLAYMGVIQFTFSQPAHVPVASKVPEGTIAVPIAVRRIPAYHQLTRDDVLDPQTAQPRFRYLRPNSGPNPPITNAAVLVGRVLRADHPQDNSFTEADFFPRGTAPGNAAAIPPGKRAMTIDASKVSGVFALLPGNHVDLVASQVIDKGPANANWPLSSSNSAAYPPGSVKHATFSVLVRNGVVITPVVQRQSTYVGQGGGLVPSAELKQKPVQEIMIAVDPEEVPQLSEALAAGAQINCFLCFSQPTPAPGAQGSIPASPGGSQPVVRVVEKIVGKRHDLVYLPSAGGAGTENPSDTATGAGPGGQ